MTIFMTSQPSDPRPDVFVKGGGIDRSVPLSTIPAPDEQTLQKETDAWRDLASASSPPEFQACVLDAVADCRHVIHSLLHEGCQCLILFQEYVVLFEHECSTFCARHAYLHCSKLVNGSAATLLRRLRSMCQPCIMCLDLQVHSVLFASSGTLLLCLVDTSGRLLQLRQHARAKFPGVLSCLERHLII